jgi:hypothetical protein
MAVNNILWAEQKAAYADAPFLESNNVYWNSAGAPFVQIAGGVLGPMSRLANPMFTNAGTGNFNLQANSPAINVGALTPWGLDLNGLVVPQANLPDAGAYEFAMAAPPLPPGLDNFLYLPFTRQR